MATRRRILQNNHRRQRPDRRRHACRRSHPDARHAWRHYQLDDKLRHVYQPHPCPRVTAAEVYVGNCANDTAFRSAILWHWVTTQHCTQCLGTPTLHQFDQQVLRPIDPPERRSSIGGDLALTRSSQWQRRVQHHAKGRLNGKVDFRGGHRPQGHDTPTPGIYDLDLTLRINGVEERFEHYVSTPDDSIGANPAIRTWMKPASGLSGSKLCTATTEQVRASLPLLTTRRFRLGSSRTGLLRSGRGRY